MFPDVAQEIEEGNTRRPARVIHESRRVLFGLKIQQFRQLHFYAGDVGIEDFFREQLTLLRFSAGIADGTGRATGDSNRMVAKQLKAPQGEQWHETTDMQTIRSRVKSTIKRDGRGQFFSQFRQVSAIGNEAAPL